MRCSESNGNLSVRAIVGANVVILAIDIKEAALDQETKDLLGFAIERIEFVGGQVFERYWLRGMKRFEEKDQGVAPGTLLPLSEHPLQSFQWGDYTVKPGHDYEYRIVPARGKPKLLALDEQGAVAVKVTAEPEDAGKHAVYFNRGVAASQAYARKFTDPRPDPNDPTSSQMKWLSRGLYEALLDFIGQAKGPEFGLRGAFYEFTYLPVGKAFKQAIDRGADVKIIYDGINYADANDAMVGAAEIAPQCKQRKGNKTQKHNKFLVLLKDGNPVSVWTGSTNISLGGIFGHSNVAHIVRDEQIAAKYLSYWEKLWDVPECESAILRKINDSVTPRSTSPLPSPDSVNVLFSPRALPTLDWYAGLMDSAKRIVCFTVPFTIDKRFATVLQKQNDVLRFILKDKAGKDDEDIQRDEDVLLAVGSKFEKGEFPGWLGERLTGFNRNRYIHDKFMLVDPLETIETLATGETREVPDPVILTGSANFSEDSTTGNDENMLLIRGDMRCADIYFGEFMRIFDHIYTRYLVKRSKSQNLGEKRKNYLKPDSSWVGQHFGDGPKAKRRRYFRGP